MSSSFDSDMLNIIDNVIGDYFHFKEHLKNDVFQIKIQEFDDILYVYCIQTSNSQNYWSIYLVDILLYYIVRRSKTDQVGGFFKKKKISGFSRRIK